MTRFRLPEPQYASAPVPVAVQRTICSKCHAIERLFRPERQRCVAMQGEPGSRTVRRTAAETALRRDTETRGERTCRVGASPRAFDPVVEMQQPEKELATAPAVEVRKRCEITCVIACDRHRKVHPVDRARYRGTQAVRYLDQLARILRLFPMPVVHAAIAKMIGELRALRHGTSEARQAR